MKENTFVRKNLRAERHDVCNSPKSFWKEPDVQGREEGDKADVAKCWWPGWASVWRRTQALPARCWTQFSRFQIHFKIKNILQKSSWICYHLGNFNYCFNFFNSLKMFLFLLGFFLVILIFLRESPFYLRFQICRRKIVRSFLYKNCVTVTSYLVFLLLFIHVLAMVSWLILPVNCLLY